MFLFKKKQEVKTEDFCREFYEQNILNPVIEGVNMGSTLINTYSNSIIEADDNFKNINDKKFSEEIILLRFELFALAWLHKFGEKSAITQSIFTKNYLHEKKLDKIWEDSKHYTQAIAHSSKLGNTPETASGRAYLGMRDNMLADLFDKYHKKNDNPECISRMLNRTFTEVAWKKNSTANYLMLVLCDRLGCELNEEAQFRLTAVIRGFYDGAKQSFDNIKIKK